VLKPYRWIRSKFLSKEKVAVEDEEATVEPLSIQESVAGAAVDVLEIIKAKPELTKKTEGRIERSAPAAEPLVEPYVQVELEPTVSETIVKVVEKTKEIVEPDVQTEQEPAISETVVEAIEKTEQEPAISETVVEIVEKTEHEPAISETVVEIVEKAKEKKPAKKQKAEASGKPAGDRWAIAAPGVDLSGEWTLVVNENFRKDYDEYLKQLGQPFIVRSVALTIIALTSEVTQQSEEGRNLLIRGTNARGIWKRTLVASGADSDNDEFTPVQVPIVTADDERVEAEAWWEEKGTVHLSWMRGLNKYGGGDFESRRYLEDGGKVLVCESTFHPREKDRKDASVTWRFLRNGEQLAIDET
jgi:bacterioferritin (cytochrome b1)